MLPEQLRRTLTWGGDLDWPAAVRQRPGEGSAGGGLVAAGAGEDVDDLSVLVDGPVQIRPTAGDLHLRFSHEPPVAGTVPAGPGRVGEQGCEALHPAVDRDVVDLEAPFGAEFLDVPVRQRKPQVPADRQDDHLGWNRNPANSDVRTGTWTRRRRIHRSRPIGGYAKADIADATVPAGSSAVPVTRAPVSGPVPSARPSHLPLPPGAGEPSPADPPRPHRPQPLTVKQPVGRNCLTACCANHN